MLVALGGPLMAIEGWEAPEVERTYTRAQRRPSGVPSTPRAARAPDGSSSGRWSA